MRVLMLGWEYPPRFVGGLGKASQGIARGLAALGLEVLFVLPGSGARQDGHGLTVRGVQAGCERSEPGDPHWLRVDAMLFPYGAPLTRRLPGDAEAALYGGHMGREVNRFTGHVARLAARAQPDLVHAHDWMTFPAALAAADRQRVPLFLHVHSTEYDRSGAGANPVIVGIERAALARATRVFAVSAYTRDMLMSRYGVPADRIRVVYNAPDATDLEQAPPALRERAPWIVFLGRLTFQKGPDHFLRAAAQVAQFNPRARFLICGRGDMEPALRALAAELGIADRVEFRGFLQPAQVDRLLRQCALLVMSSVSEPFGLVALEALRAGTPVIVSRQSGVREVLGHGLEVDFWDADKLADQMLAVLRLPALGVQLVEEGRRHLARLSWQASAQRVLEQYRAAGCGREAGGGSDHGA